MSKSCYFTNTLVFYWKYTWDDFKQFSFKLYLIFFAIIYFIGLENASDIYTSGRGLLKWLLFLLPICCFYSYLVHHYLFIILQDGGAYKGVKLVSGQEITSDKLVMDTSITITSTPINPPSKDVLNVFKVGGVSSTGNTHHKELFKTQYIRLFGHISS